MQYQKFVRSLVFLCLPMVALTFGINIVCAGTSPRLFHPTDQNIMPNLPKQVSTQTETRIDSERLSSLVHLGNGSGIINEFSINDNGRYVAFTGLYGDFQLLDRQLGTTTLINHLPGLPGMQVREGGYCGGISGDGRFVVFDSYATNLVPNQVDPNDTNSDPFRRMDVFLFDRQTGINTLVSHSVTSLATTGNQGAFFPRLSRDGRYVTFLSYSSDLLSGQIDTNNQADAFIFDRMTGTTRLLSHIPGSLLATGNGSMNQAVEISEDGRFAAFLNSSTNLIPGQNGGNLTNAKVFLADVQTGDLTLVSHAANLPNQESNHYSESCRMSADGRWITFGCLSSNLIAGHSDSNYLPDVYLFDRKTGITTVVSHTLSSPLTAADYYSSNPTISDDGRYVTYESAALNLVAGQTDSGGFKNIFLFDRLSGMNRMVSHQPGTIATGANQSSFHPTISGNGQFIGFGSQASNLVSGQIDTNNDFDLFLYDQVTNEVQLLTHTFDSPVTTGNQPTFDLVTINRDGSLVGFDSGATNLFPHDPSTFVDAFIVSTGCSRIEPVTTLTTLPGTFFTQTFTTEGENGTPTFSLLSGTLPPGFTLAPNGVLSGTTNQLGFYTFTVQAANNVGCTVSRIYTLLVLGRPTITSSQSPNVVQGSLPAPFLLATVNDLETPAANLMVVPTSLPNGVTVSNLTNTNGTISAVLSTACNATLGSGFITLSVTDADGLTASGQVPVTISPNLPPVLGRYPVMTGTVGTAVTVTPSAPPSDNGTIVSMNVVPSSGYSGTLTIQPLTGVITALPTLEGTFTVTVTVTDNCGATSSTNTVLTVLAYGKGPSLFGVSPFSGPVGTQVILNGNNLATVSQVFFNGRPANFSISSATEITAFVPDGAVTGPVSVKSPMGSAQGPTFTVIRTK